MARIEEFYNGLFEIIENAIERQRDLFSTAFGKENAQDIIKKAEENRKNIEVWEKLLQDLRNEMMASGLFNEDEVAKTRKRRTYSSKSEKRVKVASNKPISVTVLGQQKDIRYWKDIPLFVCETLYKKHPQMFTNIDKEPTLRGSNKPYITTESHLLRRPEKIVGSPYFLEINLNREDCKKIAVSILEHFGYKPTDISIVESARISAAQKVSEPNYSLFESNKKVKIGRRAESAFAKLLTENRFTEEELMLLCNEEYSRRVLGLNYPLLRLWDIGRDAIEVRKGKDGRPRYYKNPYLSHNKRYFICSQWFDHQSKKLESYLKKYGV